MALTEASLLHGFGCRVSWEVAPSRFFSESQARALLACAPEAVEGVLAGAARLSVPAQEIGEVCGDRLDLSTGDETASLSVEHLRRQWSEALPRALGL